MNKILIVAIAAVTFATSAKAEYLGRLSANPFYGDSCSNPYSRCGNPFSPDSPNNPYGKYGNPYSPYSVNNPYGPGLRVYGDGAPDDE